MRGYKGTPLERFERKVRRYKKSGCWIWVGARDKKGYGSFRYDGKTAKAHRVAWLLFRGPIPKGMQIDHLCRRPSCVNPDHLEVVTAYENFLRGSKGSAGGRTNKLKKRCPRGHRYDKANTYLYRGQRFCRRCHRERRRKAPPAGY